MNPLRIFLGFTPSIPSRRFRMIPSSLIDRSVTHQLYGKQVSNIGIVTDRIEYQQILSSIQNSILEDDIRILFLPVNEFIHPQSTYDYKGYIDLIRFDHFISILIC
jgi:hypothetical protein